MAKRPAPPPVPAHKSPRRGSRAWMVADLSTGYAANLTVLTAIAADLTALGGHPELVPHVAERIRVNAANLDSAIREVASQHARWVAHVAEKG